MDDERQLEVVVSQNIVGVDFGVKSLANQGFSTSNKDPVVSQNIVGVDFGGKSLANQGCSTSNTGVMGQKKVGHRHGFVVIACKYGAWA